MVVCCIFRVLHPSHSTSCTMGYIPKIHTCYHYHILDIALLCLCLCRICKGIYSISFIDVLMGKVTHYRSVFSYSKLCVSKHQHRNYRKRSYRMAFHQLPSLTSSLPLEKWTDDLVTELLHKSTSSALYLLMQTTEIWRKSPSFPFTYLSSSL